MNQQQSQQQQLQLFAAAVAAAAWAATSNNQNNNPNNTSSSSSSGSSSNQIQQANLQSISSTLQQQQQQQQTTTTSQQQPQQITTAASATASPDQQAQTAASQQDLAHLIQLLYLLIQQQIQQQQQTQQTHQQQHQTQLQLSSLVDQHQQLLSPSDTASMCVDNQITSLDELELPASRSSRSSADIDVDNQEDPVNLSATTNNTPTLTKQLDLLQSITNQHNNPFHHNNNNTSNPLNPFNHNHTFQQQHQQFQIQLQPFQQQQQQQQQQQTQAQQQQHHNNNHLNQHEQSQNQQLGPLRQNHHNTNTNHHHHHHNHHHPYLSLHHSSIQTQQQLMATKGFNPLAVVGAGQQTVILTPIHLKKAKLMFFYVRYPQSATLKDSFRDVQFNKNNTAQLVKWFSNFREFYYIQMEKYARDAIKDNRIQRMEDIHVGHDHELINQLNNHYNKNRHIELPEEFRKVVEETLRHFFDAIHQKRDSEQSWKKAIYKIIARLDCEVPELFKTEQFNEILE